MHDNSETRTAQVLKQRPAGSGPGYLGHDILCVSTMTNASSWLSHLLPFSSLLITRFKDMRMESGVRRMGLNFSFAINCLCDLGLVS